ncbi:MAG: hypothetical protein ACRD0W_00220 [Acidimicrobiales bacterium]
MTVYLGRPSWTSTAASGETLTGAELVGPAYHWPGTTQKLIGVETQAATATRLRGYRNFHVTGRGWRDIGYNFAFDQAGRVWLARSVTWGGSLVGAHCASDANPRANHKYVGCLLILGADERPSAAMLEAINDWYWDRFLSRWPGRTDNRGHGQVPGASTSCQGSAVRAALAAGTIPGPEEDDMDFATFKKFLGDAIQDFALAFDAYQRATATAVANGTAPPGLPRDAQMGRYLAVLPWWQLLGRHNPATRFVAPNMHTAMARTDWLARAWGAAGPGVFNLELKKIYEAVLAGDVTIEEFKAALAEMVLKVDINVNAIDDGVTP